MLSWSLLGGAQAARANATSTETAAAMYKNQKRGGKEGREEERKSFLLFFSPLL